MISDFRSKIKNQYSKINIQKSYAVPATVCYKACCYLQSHFSSRRMGRPTTRRKPGDLPFTLSIKLSGQKVWVWVILCFSPMIIKLVVTKK
jgi:hypothetical protein